MVRTIAAWALALLLLAGGRMALAQDADAPPSDDPPAAGNGMVDSEQLREMLEDLGYSPRKLDGNASSAWQIDLQHGTNTRRHLVGIDPGAGTLFIIGGGFSHAPDPKKASNDFFRRLMKHNHQMSPNYIFINDYNVFGLATIFGNVNITPARLRAKIKEHQTNFDSRLVPLVNELPSQEKEPAPPAPPAASTRPPGKESITDK